MKCGDTMWNDGVVHVEHDGVLMQNVVCGIPSDVQWFNDILAMAV